MDIIEKLGISASPWELRKEVDGGYSNTLTWIVNSKKGIAKTTNQTRCGYFKGTQEERESNAQLIATAPEMLEALIEELQWSENIETDNDIASMKIKSIIEKATNKSWEEIKELI